MEIVWNDLYLLQDKTFFVWKLGMMDALLNSCIWDISFIVQLFINIEQVLEVQKKRLEA
jgi:PI-3-kinase-related kinase SMG-1